MGKVHQFLRDSLSFVSSTDGSNSSNKPEALEMEKQPRDPSTLSLSMVTITDRNSEDLSVFPPVNHEGLHNSVSPDFPFSSSSFSSSSSSSSTSISVDSDDSELGFVDTFLPPPPPDSTADCIDQSPQQRIDDSGVRIAAACGWLRFGLEILLRKIRNSTSSVVPAYGALLAAFRSFPLLTTLTAVYVGSLLLKWFRLRRMRRDQLCETNVLMAALREKDEKIVKLLDQIARLNQVLLSHQRSQ